MIYCLHHLIYLGPASYAQARIWLDESTRFDSDKPLVAIYNMPFLYRLTSHHTLSIKQLRHALHLLLVKHLSLRTALIFDERRNLLIQRVIDFDDDDDDAKQLFTFTQSIFETDEQLTHIMHEEKHNAQLFDLAQGLVFRCHMVYYKQISPNNLLCDKDVVMFNFHQASFDFRSIDVFLHDLEQAYSADELSINDDIALRYLDCK